MREGEFMLDIVEILMKKGAKIKAACANGDVDVKLPR